MRPNLLLIHSHDLGQHLSCYGATTVHTPHLDALAAGGALLENHFCTSPGCSPSRAALWTGRYPHRTGVHGLTHGNFMWDLNADERHLAAILADHGYETVLAGGYHEARRRPEELGYGRWLSDDGFLGFRPAREVADAAGGFLDGRGSAHGDTPFFLSVGLFEPHRVFDFGGVGPDREKGVAIPGWIPTDTEAKHAAAEAEFAALQGAIREMDRQVGRILARLQANGLAQNTVVVFTSDHGLAMPRAKCSLYDPGIEVPLILRDPREPAWHGIRRSGLCENTDVAPTLLDLLGLPGEPRMTDGRSLRPLLDADGPFREHIFAEKTYHRDYDPIRCVRTATQTDRQLREQHRLRRALRYPAQPDHLGIDGAVSRPARPGGTLRSGARPPRAKQPCGRPGGGGNTANPDGHPNRENARHRRSPPRGPRPLTL